MRPPQLLGGAISALLAVGLGAFGAHGLTDQISPTLLATYETANEYHFYHAFALLITGLLALHAPGRWWTRAGWCFGLGLFCFSGSLYLLATRSLTGLDAWTPVLGPITPLGGLFFILGWGFLCVGILRHTAKRPIR